ncbi:Hypothetical protein NTJ_15863 [Nesidiocoris tenuis]|uniref:Gustatory receptor n=1 Tax=Nesidiocoris tenuis TaxID=355587 RepID=A0ABN7BF95_9HEMI|nr:Hypothetical protein NTJ_15863 [Nesidiocoris tenuis]
MAYSAENLDSCFLQVWRIFGVFPIDTKGRLSSKLQLYSAAVFLILLFSSYFAELYFCSLSYNSKRSNRNQLYIIFALKTCKCFLVASEFAWHQRSIRKFCKNNARFFFNERISSRLTFLALLLKVSLIASIVHNLKLGGSLKRYVQISSELTFCYLRFIELLVVVQWFNATSAAANQLVVALDLVKESKIKLPIYFDGICRCYRANKFFGLQLLINILSAVLQALIALYYIAVNVGKHFFGRRPTPIMNRYFVFNAMNVLFSAVQLLLLVTPSHSVQTKVSYPA